MALALLSLLAIALGLCGGDGADTCAEVNAADNEAEVDDEATLLAIRKKPFALDPKQFSGTNREIGYNYSFETDCYHGFSCPNGSWCQVEERPNWYPWDVSYMNRGRCLPYTKLYGACEEAFEGNTAFPRKADGTFFDRPVHCGPENETVCTGEDYAKVVPSMCVKKRDPFDGCMSSFPKCAGRDVGDDPMLPKDLTKPCGACPEIGHDFCVCPRDMNFPRPPGSSCLKNSTVTREKLEQCGSIFNSFNGPVFAFSYVNDSEVDGLPNDANMEAGETAELKKIALKHGRNAKLANRILKTLWPFPVCSNKVTSDCTTFPLPVTWRDPDGNLGRNYTNGSNATFLPMQGRGVVDYHCAWMTMHTLSFNGAPVLTAEEAIAFGEMLMYVSGQFDCKVCRNHFASIIEMYGLPSGNVRETYARWLWRAHNIANEHTYATHSPSTAKIIKSRMTNDMMSPYERRSSDWGNPNYMHPWFMTFTDALAQWSNVPGTKQ